MEKRERKASLHSCAFKNINRVYGSADERGSVFMDKFFIFFIPFSFLCGRSTEQHNVCMRINFFLSTKRMRHK